MSDATAGMNIVISRGDGGGPEVFTALAEVRNFSHNLVQNTAEVTHMQSPGDYVETIGTTLDPGELSMELNFLPGNATQKQVLADYEAHSVNNYKIVFTDSGSTEWILPVLVTAFNPSGSFDDALRASVTLRVAGQPTLVTS